MPRDPVYQPPQIAWTAAHKQLRRRLNQYQLSAEELRWLQAHVQDPPPLLRSMIRAQVAAAENGGQDDAVSGPVTQDDPA